MIIIGEKLNSSIPSAKEAFEKKDEAFVVNLIKKQCDAGAHYLDINTSVTNDERGNLKWVVELAKQNGSCNIMIDSPDPQVVAWIYSELSLENSVINSITLEEERLTGMLPIVTKYNTGIVALPISDEGMPKTAQQRVENAKKLITILEEQGVPQNKIFIDILVEAAGAAFDAPKEALLATRMLREEYPEIHLVAGLSNISFGLPKRGVINQAFLSSAMTMGLDAAIMDPTNAGLKMNLLATDMLLGNDEYCMNYLTGYRTLEEN